MIEGQDRLLTHQSDELLNKNKNTSKQK